MGLSYWGQLNLRVTKVNFDQGKQNLVPGSWEFEYPSSSYRSKSD